MHTADPDRRTFRLPSAPIEREAIIVGLPAAALSIVLLLTAAGADNAGLAFLTFLAMLGTLFGGVLGAVAMARTGERSLLIVTVMVAAVLVLAFMFGEALL